MDLNPARALRWVVPLGFLVCGSAATAQCPQNTYAINQFSCAILTSTAPTLSYSNYCLTGSGVLQYDLVNGTISCSALGTPESIENLVQTSDDFVLLGPSGGGPVTITAVFTGSISHCGLLKLYSGTSRDSAVVTGPARLEIAMAHSVGEHFPLSMVALTCSNGPQAVAQGSFGFTALPPGYSLQSCQGYAGAVVPTQRTSWGRLKAHYR